MTAGSSNRRQAALSIRMDAAVVWGHARKASSSAAIFVVRLALILCLSSVVATPQVHALDPRRALTQYGLKHWGPENGLPCYSILSVIQSSDGYCGWGPRRGWCALTGCGQRSSTRPVIPNWATASSSWWHRTPSSPAVCWGNYSGVFSFQGNTARPFPTAAKTAPQTKAGGSAFPGRSVRAVNRDEADGTLWVGTAQGLFCVCPDGRVLGPDAAAGRPQAPVFALCRDGAGRLCVGTAQGLFRQPKSRRGEPGGLERVPALGEVFTYCLAPASDGSLWVGTHDGAGRLREDTFLPRAELVGRSIMCLREDRAGMLWAGEQRQRPVPSGRRRRHAGSHRADDGTRTGRRRGPGSLRGSRRQPLGGDDRGFAAASGRALHHVGPPRGSRQRLRVGGLGRRR